MEATVRRVGFDIEELGSQKFRLHPDVILLPVHVHVFAHAEGGMPNDYWPNAPIRKRYVQQWFDGRDVGMYEMWEVNDDDASNLGVTTGTVWPDWPLPDEIWTQCNIQFRLVSYEVIPQEDELEYEIFNADEFCGSFGGACREDTRLYKYWNDPDRVASLNPGIHIYMGGEIDATECSGGFFPMVPGVTCSAGCAASDDPDVFIALNMPTTNDHREISSRIFAHELGHYLGLGHAESSCVDDWPDGDPSLMSGGLGDDTRLTAQQCAQARSVAQEYMTQWGCPGSSVCP